LFALFTNPTYLVGAVRAIFISFMKPQKDVAKVALYGGFFGVKKMIIQGLTW